MSCRKTTSRINAKTAFKAGYEAMLAYLAETRGQQNGQLAYAYVN